VSGLTRSLLVRLHVYVCCRPVLSHDVHTLGGATAKHCLLVVPGEKGKPQKLATGDATGTVTCFEVLAKKSKIEVAWKHQPTAKRDVTAMTLGGSKKEGRDKVFVAFGTTIQGINKKVNSSINRCAAVVL
jgi:hypothetical protein